MEYLTLQQFRCLTQPMPPAHAIYAIYCSGVMREAAASAHASTEEEVREPSGSRSWRERLAELKACPWYWGDVPWRDAERLLAAAGPGSFLVRDSRSQSHLFTVSFNADGHVSHARVGQSGQWAHLGGPQSAQRSDSVVTLLESAVKASLSGERHLLMHRKGEEAGARALSLRRPLSRVGVLPSLQYTCRLRIRELCPSSAVPSLPLPPRLKLYVQDPHYLVPPIEPALKALEDGLAACEI